MKEFKEVEAGESIYLLNYSAGTCQQLTVESKHICIRDSTKLELVTDNFTTYEVDTQNSCGYFVKNSEKLALCADEEQALLFVKEEQEKLAAASAQILQDMQRLEAIKHTLTA